MWNSVARTLSGRGAEFHSPRERGAGRCAARRKLCSHLPIRTMDALDPAGVVSHGEQEAGEANPRHPGWRPRLNLCLSCVRRIPITSFIIHRGYIRSKSSSKRSSRTQCDLFIPAMFSANTALSVTIAPRNIVFSAPVTRQNGITRKQGMPTPPCCGSTVYSWPPRQLNIGVRIPPPHTVTPPPPQPLPAVLQLTQPRRMPHLLYKDYTIAHSPRM